MRKIPMNEDFLREGDMRFEALQQLREIQAGLVGVSFLPVLSIMRPDNEYRKDVISFQDELDGVVLKVQEFISKVKNDVEYEEGDAEDDGDAEVKDDEVDGEEVDDEEDEDKKKPKKVIDSSEPKE